MATFLSRLEVLLGKMVRMNELVLDTFYITKILISLLERYSYYVSAWESAPEDKQTVEDFTSRLLVEEERLKQI